MIFILSEVGISPTNSTGVEFQRSHYWPVLPQLRQSQHGDGIRSCTDHWALCEWGSLKASHTWIWTVEPILHDNMQTASIESAIYELIDFLSSTLWPSKTTNDPQIDVASMSINLQHFERSSAPLWIIPASAVTLTIRGYNMLLMLCIILFWRKVYYRLNSHYSTSKCYLSFA